MGIRQPSPYLRQLVTDFLRACCEKGDRTHAVAKDTLYAAFLEWADLTGKANPPAMTVFSRVLLARGDVWAGRVRDPDTGNRVPHFFGTRLGWWM